MAKPGADSLGWLQPLDFANRVTSLNDARVHVDDDGKVRFVIAHGDPGVRNWLDTTGLPVGLATYRYVRATKAPTPVAAKVDLADVAKHLPESTPTFTSADRQAQLRSRKPGPTARPELRTCSSPPPWNTQRLRRAPGPRAATLSA